MDQRWKAFCRVAQGQFVDEEGMDDSVMNEGEVVVMRDETGEELHGRRWRDGRGG